MYSDGFSRYIDTISRTKRGLHVLIADDLAIERIAFLETVRHYLPESAAHAVNRLGLERELSQQGNHYDLVILEESLLVEQPDKRYISWVRRRYPKSKIGLFMVRENLHQLQTTPQLADFDMLLTKCSSVEAIAETLCLAFQEPR